MLPAAYYLFSLAVLAATNYRVRRRRWVACGTWPSRFFARSTPLRPLVVDGVRFTPPISYLEAGPLFWVFAYVFLRPSSWP